MLLATKTKTILASALIVGGMLTFVSGAAEAGGLGVPQSLTLEHEAIVNELTLLAGRGGSVGAAASKALPLVKTHFAKEAEFVFPPLGILPELAKGRITPDMKAAISMAERAKAAEQQLHDEHTQITSLMNDIIAAAKAGHENEVIAFATRVAAHSLNEMNVLFPTTIVIGDYLRGKMPTGQ